MSMPFDKSITKEDPYKLCFVCLGNICRSPTAEGVFQHLVNERGLSSYFYIDSAGTGAYHVGEGANSISQKTANEHGIELKSRARKFEPEDLREFDLILAMDHENFDNLQKLDVRNEYSGKLFLMREFDPQPETKAVPDPYYGGIDGFKHVFDIVYRSCEGLLDKLEKQIEG